MRATPEDLQAIVMHIGPEAGENGLRYRNNVGAVASFGSACREIEAGLSWKNNAERLEWARLLATLEWGLQPGTEEAERRFLEQAADEGYCPDPLIRSMGPLFRVEYRDLERLVQLASENWTGPPRGRRAELPFMKDAALQKIAERDLGTVALGLKSEDPKAVICFGGFVVEAVLLDLVESRAAEATAKAKEIAGVVASGGVEVIDRGGWGPGFKPDNTKKWKLHHFVDVCGPLGLQALDVNARRLASNARDWRNLAHPDKERRELAGKSLDMSDARMAQALVEKIVREVDEFVRGNDAVPRVVLPWSETNT
jgi:hypothetical protein